MKCDHFGPLYVLIFDTWDGGRRKRDQAVLAAATKKIIDRNSTGTMKNNNIMVVLGS